MANAENPFDGDAIVKHLTPGAGAIIGASDSLSEVIITPFVDAASGDFDELTADRQAILQSWRAEADESWGRFHRLLEDQRIAADETVEEQQARLDRNLKRSLRSIIDPEAP